MQINGWKSLLPVLFLNLLCTPSRDNPYDQNSPLFESFGSVIGRALTKVGNPIDSVKITFNPAGRICFSNQSGFFQIDSLPLDSCLISAERDGYAPGQKNTTIKTRSTDTVTFYLNAHPYFVSYEIQSSHIHSNPDTFSAVCSAGVNDPDGLGDIAYVFLPIEGRPETLSYQPTTATFEKRVFADSLAGGSLESLIGKDLTLTVEDNSHDSVSVSIRLVRVIYPVATPASPADGDSTIALPTFFWHALTLPFGFSYRLDIFRYGNLVWQQANSNPLDTTATVSTSLEPGAYTWAVWVVDGFGNSSRSQELGFYVR